ncbi:hypothetical protein SFR_1235 [Streptomyces sp. FR-008]|nr:hypothetical protein SFR_1235 [Streptomyces sp. FR-008]
MPLLQATATSAGLPVTVEGCTGSTSLTGRAGRTVEWWTTVQRSASS